MSNIGTYTCAKKFSKDLIGLLETQIQSASVRLDENEHARTHVHVFFQRAKHNWSLHYIDRRFGDGRIHFGAIDGAIASERNGRKESGRE